MKIQKKNSHIGSCFKPYLHYTSYFVLSSKIQGEEGRGRENRESDGKKGVIFFFVKKDLSIQRCEAGEGKKNLSRV